MCSRVRPPRADSVLGHPWSIEIAAAVTFFDSSLASQQTASAMSSGCAAQVGRNGVSIWASCG